MRSAALVTSLCLLALPACDGDAGRQASPPATAEAALAAAAAAVKEQRSEPVDQDRLAELLPAETSGLRRVELDRQRQGAVGITMTAVSAKYTAADGSSLTVALTDIGALGGLGAMGAAAWALSEFDRTTARGYERTTRFEGYKALESLSRSGTRTSAELSIIVADRFIVQLKGRDVDMDVLKSAARDIGLLRLAGLR